jgi:5-formyltetrahydrofolate cyclo-ligase
MTLREQKAQLRAHVLALRDALDPVARIEMSLAAVGHGMAAITVSPGEVVSGFLPIRSEIDIRPLMDHFAGHGARLCVPAVTSRTTIEFRELKRGTPLIDTGFGTSGPGPEAEVLSPSLMLVPLSVFDGHGNRIGYGAGYYDRYIALLHARGLRPRLIGCAYSIQAADFIPAEPHDIRLDALLTEKGLARF